MSVVGKAADAVVVAVVAGSLAEAGGNIAAGQLRHLDAGLAVRRGSIVRAVRRAVVVVLLSPADRVGRSAAAHLVAGSLRRHFEYSR